MSQVNLRFYQRASFWQDKRLHYFLFAAIGAIAALTKLKPGSYNNYLIYKYVFINLRDTVNLYLPSAHYLDVNHYGPLFSFIIAPFRFLPDKMGAVLWNIANAVFLCYSLQTLPLSKKAIAAAVFLCANELFTASVSFQFNPATAALIILSYTLVQKEKDVWAVLCVMLGAFIKLYGVVGLLFFFFSKHKKKYIGWCFVWAAVCFAAPILLSNFSNVVKTYHDWFTVLVEKNGTNVSLTSFQDISVMGMARRFMQDASIPNMPFLLAGIVLALLPLVRIEMYQNLRFQLLMLCSLLLFLVLFSTGSESPTYIIAFPGVVIWFLVQPSSPNKWAVALLIFAIILTSLSPTDIFPRFIKDEYVRKYSLKALPCFLVWLVISAELLFNKNVNKLWPKQELTGASL